MDNNINIFFNEKNENENNNLEYNINDFLNNGNDFLNNGNDFLNNDNNNFYESFLLETNKLTKYDAIRAGYGEMLVLYYDEQYVVADLLRICDYYGLLKLVKKTLKCKKQDIIDIIVLFETNKENEAIVKKRHQLWSYIMELKADKYMKQFIAF